MRPVERGIPHSREVIDLIEKSNKSTVHLSFSLVILSERSDREGSPT